MTNERTTSPLSAIVRAAIVAFLHAALLLVFVGAGGTILEDELDRGDDVQDEARDQEGANDPEQTMPSECRKAA